LLGPVKTMAEETPVEAFGVDSTAAEVLKSTEVEEFREEDFLEPTPLQSTETVEPTPLQSTGAAEPTPLPSTAAVEPTPPAVKGKFIYRPESEKTICPFNAFLINNGYIFPDEEGYVTAEAHEHAMRVDMKLPDVALKPLMALYEGRDKISLYKMDGDMSVEHTFGSGIREASVAGTMDEKFDKFEERFNDKGRFNAEALGRAVRWCRENAIDVEEKARGATMSIVLVGFIALFGRDTDRKYGKFLTSDELRDLYVRGKVYAGWEPDGVTHGEIGKAVVGIHSTCNESTFKRRAASIASSCSIL